MTFGPDVGLFASVTKYGQIDVEGDDPWTTEYIRTFHNFVIWEPTSVPGIGKIVERGFMASGFIEEERAKGVNILIADGPTSLRHHYVDIEAQAVLPKQDAIARLDGHTLRDLPPGAVLIIDGESYPAEDDTVLLDFDMPGTYRIEIRSPTQLTKTVEVIWP